MKQFHLLLVIVFCTFLVPNIAMACDHASDKETKKEMHCSMKEDQKSCCSDDLKIILLTFSLMRKPSSLTYLNPQPMDFYQFGLYLK